MKMMIAALMLVSTSAMADYGSGYDKVYETTLSQCASETVIYHNADQTYESCAQGLVCQPKFRMNNMGTRQTNWAVCEAPVETNN